MNKKILIVDDDKNIRMLCRDLLEREDFIVEEANNGFDAINRIENGNYDLVLLDLQMAEIDGFEVLKKIREFNETLPIVIMTGYATIENAVKAMKTGANDFVVKPFDIHQFLNAVKRNIELGSLTKEVSRLRMIETLLELNKNIVSLTNLETLLDKICDLLLELFSPKRISIYLLDESSNHFILRKHKYEKNYTNKLRISYPLKEVNKIFGAKTTRIEKKIDRILISVRVKGREKEIGIFEIEIPEKRGMKENEIRFLDLFATQVGIGIENSFLLEDVHSSYLNTIKSLINSLEAKDKYTKGHSEQVAYYSVLLGKRLGLSEEEIEMLKISSYLHDLGKLGIKDEILFKKGPLSPEERNIIKKHPLITVNIIQPLNLDNKAVEACLYHHERIDGRGYPKGIPGEKIPLYAKILSIADAYSAMISKRPYRDALSKEEAIKELMRNADTQFDRELVSVFVDVLNKMEVGDERNKDR
ncbi:response regulator [bacterium]|nr:response regulator [bacterium]